MVLGYILLRNTWEGSSQNVKLTAFWSALKFDQQMEWPRRQIAEWQLFFRSYI
jgi:hypothetical protein